MNMISLSGPGLQLKFKHDKKRLSLVQVQRKGHAPLLYSDASLGTPGPGPAGNPFAVVLLTGGHAGAFGPDSFAVEELSSTGSRLLATLRHDSLPMSFVMEVEVEGHVATWRGQFCWSGETAEDFDIYYPLLSRVRAGAKKGGRALTPQISGTVVDDIGKGAFRRSYIGNLSSPVILVDGGGRGIALLDDNRAEYAADPAACAQRSFVAGMVFPVAPNTIAQENAAGESDAAGPCAGVCYRRLLAAPDKSVFAADAERSGKRHSGESIDIGPVRMYVYEGGWKTGADWLRRQRSHVPFRVSPAEWYRRTTFVGEDMCDDMLSRGQSFYDYPKIMAHKETLGSNLMHIPGFHDPEVLGSTKNWLNRGDYFLAAQNLGGFEAAARGVEAIHRRGGRVLYYVEGLIVWKRSRIGRTWAKKWAMMNQNGGYDFVYRGFWHMCPACREWCDWLAQTCAEIVRTTGVDGFFVDSSCATSNHRCFNPEHNHPHPDVWAWGLRRMFRTLREALDTVNPGAVVLVEGVADMAREYLDGFVSHTHEWSRMNFGEPFVRFLHPDMRAYESWSNRRAARPDRPIEWLHVWNSVTGHRIYSHSPEADSMAALSQRTRRYYDIFPEICDSRMSALEMKSEKCYAQLFEGPPYVVTVGNLGPQKVDAKLLVPVPCGILFDRVDSRRVAADNGKVQLCLGPWDFRAFEVRA
jgi:hypothetical protein